MSRQSSSMQGVKTGLRVKLPGVTLPEEVQQLLLDLNQKRLELEDRKKYVGRQILSQRPVKLDLSSRNRPPSSRRSRSRKRRSGTSRKCWHYKSSSIALYMT